MKQNINMYEFEQAFRNYDRFDAFGYEGLKVIYDYLEQYEEECDTELELDVIAICCDFNILSFDEVMSEYNVTFESPDTGLEHTLKDNYGRLLFESFDDFEREEIVMEYLNHNTSVCGVTSSGEVVFQVF